MRIQCKGRVCRTYLGLAEMIWQVKTLAYPIWNYTIKGIFIQMTQRNESFVNCNLSVVNVWGFLKAVVYVKFNVSI